MVKSRLQVVECARGVHWICRSLVCLRITCADKVGADLRKHWRMFHLCVTEFCGRVRVAPRTHGGRSMMTSSYGVAAIANNTDMYLTGTTKHWLFSFYSPSKLPGSKGTGW